MRDMNTTYAYPAIFYRYEDGKYAVLFPDLGNATQGDHFDDAVYMAKDLLRGYIAWLIRDGDPIPTPTPINRVVLDKKDEDDDCVEVSVHLIKVDLIEELPINAYRIEAELSYIEERVIEIKQKLTEGTLTVDDVHELETETKLFREKYVKRYT